jgi:hypothetical protein
VINSRERKRRERRPSTTSLMTQTLQNRSLGARRTGGALPRQTTMPACASNGAHFSRTRSARLKRDHAGVVHGQQLYLCIIFGLFRRRNKARSAPRHGNDLM